MAIMLDSGSAPPNPSICFLSELPNIFIVTLYSAPYPQAGLFRVDRPLQPGSQPSPAVPRWGVIFSLFEKGFLTIGLIFKDFNVMAR